MASQLLPVEEAFIATCNDTSCQTEKIYELHAIPKHDVHSLRENVVPKLTPPGQQAGSIFSESKAIQYFTTSRW